MNSLKALAAAGQAVWLDYIRRTLITSGELQALIDDGLRGVTSNPTIFEKAITGSHDYDDDIRDLAARNRSIQQIFEALALKDISLAAEALHPVYLATDGVDGYVSLEVNPTLAHDTPGTIREARRLFTAVGRPNVMIKVPATPEGLPAITTLIAEGINVNVTLLFALTRYREVTAAYLAGLEQLCAAGRDPSRVASVASFFVSRVDTAVDRLLPDTSKLRGTIAVTNAAAAYALFHEIFSGPRWESLHETGARAQRLLWASTGTKNPTYPDTVYVDRLVAPHTVNTLPPATLLAWRDHGAVTPVLNAADAEARRNLGRLEEEGIDLAAITEELLTQGLESFGASFESLLDGIAAKRRELLTSRQVFTLTAGVWDRPLNTFLRKLATDKTIHRIWEHDHTVWHPEPGEIANRLGWLTIADVMDGTIERIETLAAGLTQEGFTHAVLLGMGGSSLAPEVLRRTFGVAEGFLELTVCDSTAPATVAGRIDTLDPRTTLFLVSTKSGTTAETLALFRHCWRLVTSVLSPSEAGRHFVAITDPATPLLDLAARHQFRATFVNDPTIGGRYAALSYVGLVPAALMGIDLATLLGRAQQMSENAQSCNCPLHGDNYPARLGATLGTLATEGRDKITFCCSPSLTSFADWAEQLIAESTGKGGTGILPVVHELPVDPGQYGNDRIFAILELDGEEFEEAWPRALQDAGHPLIRLHLHDVYDLGAQFFLWEMATAVAGHFLGINPFDQPDVETAKHHTRLALNAWREQGSLPEPPATFTDGDISAFGDLLAQSLKPALNEFLSGLAPDGYIAIHAYLPADDHTLPLLERLRQRLFDRCRQPVTLGFGPRFLHSTGQLHKGDAGRGRFLQLTADPVEDLPIPDEAASDQSSLTFGTLIHAQALGDQQALTARGRTVLHLHLGTDPAAALQRILEAL